MLLLCLALVLAFTLVFAPAAYASGGSENDEEDEPDEEDDVDRRPANWRQNDRGTDRIRCTIRQGNGGVMMLVATPGDCRRAQERAAAGRQDDEHDEEARPPVTSRPAHPSIPEPPPFGPPPGYRSPFRRR